MARITISEKEVEHLLRENVGELEPFLDIDYAVEVQLGSRHLTVGELIDLKCGDLVTLERPSSSYVDLLIGGARIAKAEVLTRKKGSVARIVRFG